MKTIEELFLETKLVFEQQAVLAIEEALDKIYQEYLPHVQSDTDSNVIFQSHRWIEKYLSDSLLEDDFKVNIIAKDVRAKIWNDNKEELKKLIHKDVLDRLHVLEERHRDAWEHGYN